MKTKKVDINALFQGICVCYTTIRRPACMTSKTESMERYDKNLKSNKLDFKVTIYREIEEELFDAKQNAMKFVEGEYKKVEIVKFVENTYNNLHDLYLIHTNHLYEN